MKRTLITLALVVVFPALVWGGFAGTEVYLPSVGLGPGYQGSHWHSGLWIRNPGTTDANVTFEFLARGTSNPAPPTAHLMVPQGETARIPDVLADLFAMSKGYGALRITSDREVLVASRAFSQPQGAGEEASTGQFFGAVPASFAIGQGDRTAVVGGFQFTPMEAGPFRYNYGFVETTGNNATVRVTAYNGPDPTTPIGSKDYTVGGYAAIQENLSKLISNPNGDNIWLRFEVISGTGKIIAFGTGVTNGSNDPSTFEMQFADSLLGSGGGGLTSVAHDSTLAGDGTSASPLGVADGGVTTSKISASGSSSGQVLTSDGAHVAWQTPSGGGGGLTLPYAGGASSPTPAFQVNNSGTGAGVRGASSSGFGGFFESGNDHLDLALGGAVGRINTDPADENSKLYLSSNDDIILKLDNDGGESAELRILNSGAKELCTVDEEGTLTCVGTAGNGTAIVGVADTGSNAWGVDGESSEGIGVRGRSMQHYGVYGYSAGGKPDESVGVVGVSDAQDGTGVRGVANSGSNSVGVLGGSSSGWAGYFVGNVNIIGSLNVAGSKNFRIDHPLDPADEYLYHAAIESDEVLNQYSGNVVLDASGHATVELPRWFEAINTDYRYQLTAIGAAAPGLYVAREIRGNRFEIAGGSPGLKVSWQITARRNDAYMRTHPFTAEREKPEELRGLYLDPVSHGQPDELGIERALHRFNMESPHAASAQPRPEDAPAESK